MEKSCYSLFELNQLIKKTLADWLPETVLVVAEISKISLNQSGHCYIDLVDKPQAGFIRAKCSATIWKNRYATISQHFEAKTGQTLKGGLKILFSATVQFHELYGLSLDIHTIDPNYTIGDLARQKQQIIERLQKEGLHQKNRRLSLAAVPQRIAVVSSPTSAGLTDFIKQLQENPYRYDFKIALFEAIMQGNDAVLSISNALRAVASQPALFDAAVIVRGGGANLDLSCFDSYDLACAIAHFPLPVLTGIGHERDDTICDVVAHSKHKTPTATAAFLIDRLREWETAVETIEAGIQERVQQYTKNNFHKLAISQLALQHAVTRFLGAHQNVLDEHKLILATLPQKLLTRQKEKLQAAGNTFRYVTCNLAESKKSCLAQYAREIKKESENVLSQELDFLSQYQQDLKESALTLLNTERNVIKIRASLIKTNAAFALSQLKFSLKEFILNYKSSLKDYSYKAHRNIENQEWKLSVYDPMEQLKRGYSLTYINGKVITSADQIQPGEIIETRLAEALIISQVITHQTYEQQFIDKRTPEATNI